MITIMHIEWISKDIFEAEVTLSDSVHELVCFAHPFHFDVGENVKQTILVLGYENLFLSYEKIDYIRYLGNFKHDIVGKFIDRNKGLVQVGEFILEGIHYVPRDILEGDYVEFRVDRCDIAV